MKRAAILILFVSCFLFLVSSAVRADECNPDCSGIEECQRKIDECTKLLQMSVSATKPHEQTALSLEKDIAAIESNVKSLSAQIDRKKTAIAADEKKFAVKQKLLDAQVRDFYKKNWTSPIEYFLATILTTEEVGSTLHSLAYRQNLIDQEKKMITSLVLEMADLNVQRKKLEDTQNWLAAKQTSLQATLAPIRKLVNEAKTYQSKLNSTVGALSAKQQQMIAIKMGSLNLSRSAGMTMSCSDDRKIDPGFGAGFAFYTFGIPHRVGMNQFGAFGRANAGQTYQDILRAYYAGINFEKKSNINIQVEGYGSMPLEQYMLGIYEVPDSWPIA